MTLIATDFHDVKTPFASQLSDELQVQQEYFILKYIKSNVEFDPTPLFQHFSDDIRYASQQVLNDLVGKDAVAEYMTGKSKTLKRKKHEWRYDFNRGYIDNVHCLNQPCMLVELHDRPFCYVTLDVDSDKKIEAINLQHVFPPVGNVKCVELFSFEELPDYRMEEGGADAR